MNTLTGGNKIIKEKLANHDVVNVPPAHRAILDKEGVSRKSLRLQESWIIGGLESLPSAASQASFPMLQSSPLTMPVRMQSPWPLHSLSVWQ